MALPYWEKVDADARARASPDGTTFSTRTAQTLNSGMRETGSSAGLVSALALPPAP